MYINKDMVIYTYLHSGNPNSNFILYLRFYDSSLNVLSKLIYWQRK